MDSQALTAPSRKCSISMKAQSSACSKAGSSYSELPCGPASRWSDSSPPPLISLGQSGGLHSGQQQQKLICFSSPEKVGGGTMATHPDQSSAQLPWLPEAAPCLPASIPTKYLQTLLRSTRSRGDFSTAHTGLGPWLAEGQYPPLSGAGSRARSGVVGRRLPELIP